MPLTRGCAKPLNEISPPIVYVVTTVTFSGQTCVNSHRALRMSIALVPFLVPQTMRWDLGECFVVVVVTVEIEWATGSVDLGVQEGGDWHSLND